MTYEMACVSCGYQFYSGFDMKSPNDVLKAVDFKCKKCGERLSNSKFTVEVRKTDGSFF